MNKMISYEYPWSATLTSMPIGERGKLLNGEQREMRLNRRLTVDKSFFDEPECSSAKMTIDGDTAGSSSYRCRNCMVQLFKFKLLKFSNVSQCIFPYSTVFKKSALVALQSTNEKS